MSVRQNCDVADRPSRLLGGSRVLLAALLAAAAFVAGCGPTGEESPTLPSPSVSVSSPSGEPSPTLTELPSPSAMASPSPASTLNPDQQAAFNALQDFLDLWWKYVQDPENANMQLILDAGTEGGTKGALNEILFLIEDRERYEGRINYRGWNVGQVQTGPTGDKEVGIEYCSDNSNLKVLDRDSGEVKSIPTLALLNRKVMREGKDGIWRILKSRNEESKC